VSTTLDPGVQYLDLDGDGVPDAVLTVESLSAAAGRGSLDSVTIIETLQCGIGIDGQPSGVEIVART
jgi:hypothetical protein